MSPIDAIVGRTLDDLQAAGVEGAVLVTFERDASGACHAATRTVHGPQTTETVLLISAIRMVAHALTDAEQAEGPAAGMSATH